jgi:hypothetical protein
MYIFHFSFPKTPAWSILYFPHTNLNHFNCDLSPTLGGVFNACLYSDDANKKIKYSKTTSPTQNICPDTEKEGKRQE